MQASQRGREWLFSILAIVIGAAVSLAAIEVASRTILDDGMNFDLEMWKYAREIKRVSPIEGLGHDHRPGSSSTLMRVPVEINSLGYRDREYSEAKPPGTIRVLMLGDSVTFGWGVKAEDTVAKLLEQKFAAAPGSRQIEVINAGVGNYNTAMEVNEYLVRGHKLDPDIVVLNYFINDAEPTPRKKDLGLLEHSYGAVYVAGKADIVQRLYFGKADWKDYYANLYLDDAPAWHETRESVARLSEYCRRNGIGLLVANYPELHQLSPYPFSGVTEKIRQLAQSQDLPFIDLLSAVADRKPDTLWVSPTDAHPNREATTAFAAALEKALLATFPDVLTN